MATVGELTAGEIQAGRKTGGVLGDDDGVALRDGSDAHREAHRAGLGDEAEVAGDDAGGLNGFEGRLRGKDDGKADG